MRHWAYRKFLFPEERGVVPQWPWSAYLEISVTILQFVLLHWLICSPQNTMPSKLSSFIHVAFQEFSLGKLSLFQDRALVLSDTGEEHSVGKKLRNYGYLLVTCFLRMLWSASTAAEVVVVCGLQIIKLPFIFQNHILSQCKIAGQGNHPVQRDRKCICLLMPATECLSITSVSCAGVWLTGKATPDTGICSHFPSPLVGSKLRLSAATQVLHCWAVAAAHSPHSTSFLWRWEAGLELCNSSKGHVTLKCQWLGKVQPSNIWLSCVSLC